jgi:hypothetical protein
MKRDRVFIVALLVVGAIGLAREIGATTALTPQEKVMVQAVMAMQKSAQAACEGLPSVKEYATVLEQANAALKAAGKSVDWRTGAVMEGKK